MSAFRKTILFVSLLTLAKFSHADTWELSQCGFDEGACMTISVTGRDADNDGQLICFSDEGMIRDDSTWGSVSRLAGAGECSSISLRFSGNSAVPATNWATNEVFGFVLDINTSPVVMGDSDGGASEGIGAINDEYTYITGPGPFVLCEGVNICGVIGANDGEDFLTSTTELGSGGLIPSAPVPTIPLPGLLLLGGLLAAFGYRQLKK